MWLLPLLIVLVLFALSFTRFEIKDEIEINADRQTVWNAIIDFPNYRVWNTQLAYLGGDVSPNGKLHLKLSVNGTDPYEFRPSISQWRENEKFAWLSLTAIPKVFDGEHFFELKSLQNGNTWLINREVYSGVLSLFMKSLPMMKEAPAGFKKMNRELKTYIENL